ncbi:heme lyase CcmF/NrfE family subunit [Aurantiacibacter rhizosphaerae]|uniref:Heme lyase CcmF/NrfE family subunit n=1 Tax=Aurantiacibacter rhizosphaerae TaxID=2691582 RepID=A0A844XHN9_9SPHN|nr:heme lyase CcmF/NrfE family subunit [Aurantiacibacter rhizosphaerae]MWV29340.1 heme lyase CcmF/NrfE family subunit [Aurantiacibacter rhizosphaerae]
MIAEIGLAALWLGAALAVLQLLGGFLGAREQGSELTPLVRPAAMLQALLCAVSFGALVYAFAVTDLSVELVATHSHSMKPLAFKLSGAWANHEGSMLLWITVMALAGGLIALIEHRLPSRMMMATLGAQAFVAVGFYLFILLSSNPFKRLSPVPADGNGLNPLLQDMGVSFHPPTLYIGYVGLSVAFSFAVGALLTRNVTPEFARVMRPWVLGSWIFLTIGIAAGSYWAYYELGWGGWWFWDPVENASLMPWLAATALLHSASVLAARDALRTWTIMLGVIAFSMSMLGTFLVRSGILTSVHAFAVDPERGSFILILLALYIGGALVLFALRASTIAEGERFALFSREGALVVNNVALSSILGIVLLGTLYPLLTEAFDVRVSVGPPYFNPVSAIFFLPMLAILAVGPLLRWRTDSFRRIRLPVIIIAVVTIAVLALVLALTEIGILPLLGLAMSVGIAIASFMPLRGRNILRTPLPIWGMCVAHFGVAVALFGVAADTAFQQERLVAASPGDVIEIGPWEARMTSVSPVAGPNWTAMQGDLLVSYEGGPVRDAHPQARSFWAPQGETSEVALLTRWNGQLYVALGNMADDGRWQLRLWWKPFVTYIWYGGLLIAFGGMLALLGRVIGDVRRRSAELREDRRRADEAELAAS